MKIDVSIIIPNYNGEKYIANCLDSLSDQSFDAIGNSEIIVVDDCSSDNSVSIIKNFQNTKLIENSINSGFARSVNQGIRASTGKYCLLLNNDVVVDRDFVKNLYDHINKNPRVFSVSSKMIRYYERDKLDDAGDFYNILGWAYKRGDGKSRQAFNKSTSIFSTCAGAGIYRRAILDEIGLFEEAFFAYMEDVDLSYRGLIYGYENHYEPRAFCYHIGSATTADGEKYSPFKVNISARNNVYVVYKNMPLVQLIFNSPFLILGFLVKYLLFLNRGYGNEYKKGLTEGLKTLRNIQKVRVQLKNIGHYFKIEVQLIINLFRFVANKLIR